MEEEPEFARGSEKASVMVVAQNPGGKGNLGPRKWKEDPRASGYFDDYMTRAIEEGWLGIRVPQAMVLGTQYASLSDVYYTNLCKCRSYDDWSTGLSGAIRHCTEYLPNEVSMLNPRLVVTFGRPAMLGIARVVGLALPSQSVRELHRRRFPIDGYPKAVLVFQHWGRRWGDKYKKEINDAFRQAVSQL